MSDFYYRAEDIKNEDIPSVFVENTADREIVDLLKSTQPVIIEGSRGIGKSFLMRVAVHELDSKFKKDRILPVYVAFMASSLLHTDDPYQFKNWMIAKSIRAVLMKFRKKNLSVSNQIISIMTGINHDSAENFEEKMNNLALAYENSYKTKNITIDSGLVPDLDYVKESFAELCTEHNIKRICLFFDEAAHVFRPSQQRQFFNLFRDLRSPHISCKAAVYPGVTHYGGFFEIKHDATLIRVDRDISDPEYIKTMKGMVLRRANKQLSRTIENHGDLFNILAYCSSGNPRILFKTIDRCSKINSSVVDSVIKEFYRSEVWSEHTSLGERYQGHKAIIDWGRDFIENSVLPETSKKNNSRMHEKKGETTTIFWIHKNTPQIVKEAIRLLCYTGVVRHLDDGIRATRAEIGSRYSINYGCLLALEANPSKSSSNIYNNLSIKRFTEYGSNHPLYKDILTIDLDSLTEGDLLPIINRQLEKNIDTLGLTSWQKRSLHSINVNTVRDLLNISEEELKQIKHIKDTRARIVKNAAMAEVLEYLSG